MYVGLLHNKVIQIIEITVDALVYGEIEQQDMGAKDFDLGYIVQ